MATIFSYFDGDNVGSQLELLLLDNLVEDANRYSCAVNNAIVAVKTELEKAPHTEILLTGGDDLVVTWQRGIFSFHEIDSMRLLFHQICRRTLSAGVGFTASRAVGNLRRAKLMGKDQICFDSGVWGDDAKT